MNLKPVWLLLLSICALVWSVPIDRNAGTEEAVNEVPEENGVKSSHFAQLWYNIWFLFGSFKKRFLSFSSLLQDTGLYYDRYLREVIEVLETDPHFREKLQTANTEDIKVSFYFNLTHKDPCFNFTSPASSPVFFLLFSVRTVVSVKSWTWSATMCGPAWTSWSVRKFPASGCCLKPNWTAQTFKVRERLFISDAQKKQKSNFCDI